METDELLPPKTTLVIAEPTEKSPDGFWIKYSENKTTIRGLREFYKMQAAGDVDGVAKMFVLWDLEWNLKDSKTKKPVPTDFESLLDVPTPIMSMVGEAIREDQAGPKEKS